MTHLTYAYTSSTGTQGMRIWNLSSTFILKSGVSILVLKNCIVHVCAYCGDGGGGCGGECMGHIMLFLLLDIIVIDEFL